MARTLKEPCSLSSVTRNRTTRIRNVSQEDVQRSMPLIECVSILNSDGVLQEAGHSDTVARGLKLFAEAGQFDAARDVVLNPVWIPPLLGIDLNAVKLHGEVNVVATCHPGH